METKTSILFISQAFMILLSLILSPASAQDGEGVESEVEPIVHIVPPHQAVGPGETISMDCVHYPENLEEDALIEWYLPGWDIPLSSMLQNQSIINQMSSDIPRFSVKNNTLTIENITMADAGVYTCKNGNGTLEAETIIKVYVMPSYLTEGMIVVGINLGLVAVFIGCLVWQRLSEKRRLTKNNRMSKLGHKEVAKRMLRQ